MRRNISMDHSLVQEAGQTGHCFDVTSRRDLAIIGALVLVLMKTTRVLLFALIAALWISIQFAGAASETTHVDVLRPGTCMPGAKLYYAKNEDEEDDIMADVLAGKSRKPDAVVERFDAATQTVYFKRGNGKSESLKLSDPQAEHYVMVYEGAKAAESTPVPVRGNPGDWQKSWDGFVALAEQELNKLPPNAAGPWDGKEVTWEGTFDDMEIIMAKNVVRMVFAMPERTITVKGKPVVANRMMIFVPMNYDSFAPMNFSKGTKVRFKTTIAPIDNTHPSVAAMPGKDGKGILVITTKGGSTVK